MAETLPLVVSAIALFAVFLWLRPRCYPSGDRIDLPDRATAIRWGEEAAMRLSGLDVSGWRVHAAVSVHDELVQQLHHAGHLEAARELLMRWGLAANWHVRFSSAQTTFLVGFTSAGEVNHLELTTLDPDDLPAMPSTDDIIRRLDGERSGSWATSTPAGEAAVAGQGEADELMVSRIVREKPVALQLEVRHAEERVTSVSVTPVVKAAAVASSKRAESWDGVMHAFSFLFAAAALVAGMVVIGASPTPTDWTFGLVLASLLIFAMLLGELDVTERLAVQAYEVFGSWPAFVAANVAVSVLSGVAMAAVVLIGGAAASELLGRAGIPVEAGVSDQVLAGAWLATAWLTLTTGSYTVLRRLGWVRIVPELDPRSMVLAGHNARQALSLSLQSAISEETVFRMVALPLFLRGTGNVWVAIGLSSVLWALAHSSGGVEPRRARILELAVVGCGLGAALVAWGAVSVLVAHFLANLTLTVAPLVRSRLHSPPAAQIAHGG